MQDAQNLLVFSGNANKPLAQSICKELGVQPVSKEQNDDPAAKVPTAPAVPDLEPDPELERVRQSKQ